MWAQDEFTRKKTFFFSHLVSHPTQPYCHLAFAMAKIYLCDLKRPVARNIGKIPLTSRAFAKNAFLRHFGDFQPDISQVSCNPLKKAFAT